MGYTHDSGSSKKKLAIIGVSSILLVAAVVGSVTYAVVRKNGDSGDQGGNSGQIAPSSKATQAICQHTDYKEACQKSLAGAKNSSDPKELMRLALQAASDSVTEVIKNSTLLKKANNDPRVSEAMDVCNDVLENSIDDLNRSFKKIGSFDPSKFDEYLSDIKTWLSGAITQQDTCLQAFENTTGDTGEKMENLMNSTRELSSNGLAMIDSLSQVLKTLQIPGISSRRLLSEEELAKQLLDDEPDFVRNKRMLLQANPATLKPNAVVSQDGKGQFRTVMDAVKTIPKKNNQTFVILVKAGIYKEYIDIPRGVNKVVLLGEGPTKTKITGNKNYADGTSTYRTATVSVNGEEFIARDIGIENTAGAIKHQAVALRVSGDKAIFYNCQLDGFQDTLYVHTYRQYYRDCVISGTIDFIFGDSSAVFQNCHMIVRKPLDNQACMVTAQGRQDPRGIGGIVLQNCTISAEAGFVPGPKNQAFLGRPWKQYSRTLVMQSFIDNVIAPEGWAPWTGTFGLDTCYYGEFQNRGPGSNTAQRVKWKGIKQITPQIAQSFTPGIYIQGDEWIRPSGFPYEPGMIRV